MMPAPAAPVLYRAGVMDVPQDPFRTPAGEALRADADAGIVVAVGRIVARGPYEELRRQHADVDVVDLRSGVLLPGLVDTHVHYPQLRIIGGLGLPLLDWLDRCALPEEARFAERSYAAVLASEFLGALAAAGTTTALVFGSHFAGAVDELFTAAAGSGLRITAGLVVSDRLLREDLLTTPDAALAESRELIGRWHGKGRLRFAVTPRFSLSASAPMLEVCAELLRQGGVWFTSHINENLAEIDYVKSLFGVAHYLDTYARAGLVTDRTVLAHNVHPADAELDLLAAASAWIAHCPTSNAALGSGLFPLRRHVERGVRVALGSDVGGGTGLSLFKEGLQAYFIQQLSGRAGLPLTPAHLLHLCTGAGAAALGLGDRIGDLSVGKDFDAIWVRPARGSTLDLVLGHAADASDALAKIFTLGTSADVAAAWVSGDCVYDSALNSR